MPWQGELNETDFVQYGGGSVDARRLVRKRVKEKQEISQVLRANVNFGDSARVLQDTIQDGSHGASVSSNGGGDFSIKRSGGHHIPTDSSGSSRLNRRTSSITGVGGLRSSTRDDFRGGSQDVVDTGFVSDYHTQASDIQKLDEWLKHPTDSLSSMEFDGDIKTIEEEEFYKFGQDHDDSESRLTDAATETVPNLLFESSATAAAAAATSRRSSAKLIAADCGSATIDLASSSSANRVVNFASSDSKSRNRSESFGDVTSSVSGKETEFAVSAKIADMKSEYHDDSETALTALLDENAVMDISLDNHHRHHHHHILPPLGQLNFAETTSMDIMLMTPQELERMPESGIEFEESVGPKESEPLPLDIDQFTLPVCLPEEEPSSYEVHLVNDELMEAADECEKRPAADVDETLPEKVAPKAEVVAAEREIVSAELEIAPMEPETLLESTDELPYVDESATLATISISQDAESNTTSIIINTEQGQKEFRIATNNLMQAAANLQPISLADLVSEQGITVVSGDPVLDVDQSGPAKPATVKKQRDATDGDFEYATETITYPTAGCQLEEKCTGSVCTHTGRCKMTWSCPEPDCGKSYSKQCKLKVHLMTHTGVRPHKCTVEGCDWSFTTVYKLKRHLETHGGNKDFRCDFEGCNKPFTTIYNLNSHKKLHTQPNAVPCPIEHCDQRFPNRRKMELHLREHNEVEAPYRCPEPSCDKTYYTANSMASHLRCHQKTAFPCTFENCDLVFDKFSRYKTHLWRHTGERPYVCSHDGCGWAFSSASKRKRHMQKHTGERQYTCTEPGCGKSFRRLEHMQGHAITHSGEKPFVCPHPNCEARFTARSSLYVHIKKHTGANEKLVYPCPIENCTKKYNCKSSLRQHMLKYHTPILADAGHLDYVTWLTSDDYQACGGVAQAKDYVLQAVTEAAIQVEATGSCETGVEEVVVGQMEMVATDQDDAAAPVSAAATPLDIPSHVGAQIVIADPAQLPVLDLASIASHQLLVTAPSPVEESDDAVEVASTSGLLLCDLESLGSSRVLQENHSGSARTDYCSNHMTLDRLRRQKQLLLRQQETAHERILEITDVRSLASNTTANGDVILGETVFVTGMSIASATGQYGCMPQSQLLQDDPPSHGDLYHDDGLLTSMAKDLAVPISMLTEVSVVDPSTVSEFTDVSSTINLRDLE